MNLQEIKELIRIIDETDISELNLESDGMKVVIRKGACVSGDMPGTNVVNQKTDVVIPTVHTTTETTLGTSESVIPPNMEIIKSPMVGTFYSAQSPEAEPFVKVGQHIQTGQSVCIIEAMKLMNEIESEIEGKVIEILVENGQPVEYGQPLFLIQK